MIVGDEWLECLLSVPIIAILPFAGGDLGDAPGGSYRSRSRGCLCRTDLGQHKRDGLRIPLHRRFVAVRCGLVRRHDCALHLGGGDAWAAFVALVAGSIENVHVGVSV